jgi:hypothetical protein
MPASEAAVESRGVIKRSKSGKKEALQQAKAFAQTMMMSFICSCRNKI